MYAYHSGILSYSTIHAVKRNTVCTSQHIRGDEHRKYVREEKIHYKDLDALIRKGQTAEAFLQSVVNKQKLTSPVIQSQMRYGKEVFFVSNCSE